MKWELIKIDIKSKDTSCINEVNMMCIDFLKT